MYAHTCIHARVHMQMYTCRCTHAHMHTCTHAHMHTCTHAHMHAGKTDGKDEEGPREKERATANEKEKAKETAREREMHTNSVGVQTHPLAHSRVTGQTRLGGGHPHREWSMNAHD